MRRVLHVGPCETPGGMSKVIEILSQNPPHGWSTSTHTSHTNGNPIQKYLFHRRAVAKFTKLIHNTEKPDIVHIHTAADWSWKRKSRYVKICHKFNVPCVVHIHSGKFDTWLGPYSSNRSDYFRKTTSHKGCQVVVLTKGWQKRLAPIIGQCLVVNNPIDPKLNFQANYVRKAKQLLLLGRDDSVKGHDFALAVFDRLKANDPDIELIITGTDRYTRPNVRSERWITEKEKITLLQQASAILIPSRYEGQPMTMLEALYCGLNCVASDNIIDLPSTVTKAKFGDLDDWVKKVTTILESPQPAKLLHDSVEENSIDKINQKWQSVYTRLSE